MGKRHRNRVLLGGLLAYFMIAPAFGAGNADFLLDRFKKMVEFNLDNGEVVESARLNAALNAFKDRPLGDRVASWAGWFHDLGSVGYRYGRDADGYVTAGRICQDFHTDCILFMYRVTELTRSTTAEEAVQFAFGTRFYGASLETVVSEDGQVDYEDDSHLEYSEDMVESGIWGENVTPSIALETASTEAGGFLFAPAASINYGSLQSGDIIWFVGPPATAESIGDTRPTEIHHVGIIDRSSGEVELVHAAMKPLPGEYEKAGVVRLPLQTYLDRVDRFSGILVTRLAEF